MNLTTLIYIAVLCLYAAPGPGAAENAPPTGFVPLFNGRDLAGWRGGITFDVRMLQAMPSDQRSAQIARWTEAMRAQWRVENGELINDGQGLGYLATTEKNFADIELLLEYKIAAHSDFGVYLRGCPQVQIRDQTNQRELGNGTDKSSGGLWTNSAGTIGSNLLVLADNPPSQWNHLRVRQLGSRIVVWRNGRLVASNAIMGNVFDRKLPVPPIGPIQLAANHGKIQCRNIFIREVPSAEANRLLRGRGPKGFQAVFNGRDFEGWAGPIDNYEVRNGAIVCKPGKGGTIFTKEEYTNFTVRLEFKLPPGGNNGLAIRYPGSGDTAYAGMCECQVLDDHYEQATGQTIDPRQAHGSAYGMVAAQRGYQRPIGEWNYEEVTVTGSTIKVELNGTEILDADLGAVTEFMADSKHPGRTRASGHFGFAGHNDPVMFRNISIKRLD